MRRASPVPPRYWSITRAQRRPSAIAVTTRDWPMRASPHANTPSSFVPYTGALTLPRRSTSSARSLTRPSCSGWRNPIAISTRSAGTSKSLPGMACRSRDEVPSTRRACTPDTRPSTPASRVTSVPKRRAPPPSTAYRVGVRLGGSGLGGGPTLLRRDGTVALVEVLHRKVDPGELAALHVEVAMHAGADCHDDSVVALAQLLGGEIAADVDAASELDPLLLEERDPPVDDPLLELRVRHSEAQQPAGRLVALVDRDHVAELVELRRDRQTRRPGADDAHGPAGALLRRLRHDPALVESTRHDRQLDLLDRHRVRVDVEHAGRLARRRADQTGELRKVVRRVELRKRVAPAIAIDEVVPVRDQVAERAALVAERDAAVHAASALVAQPAVVGQREVLPIVAHALAGIALLEADPLQAEERAELAH